MIEVYGCAEAPDSEIAHLHRVASISTGAPPIILASVDLIQARSPTAPPPARRLLHSLPRPPADSVFVSPLAQFSMSPDNPGPPHSHRPQSTPHVAAAINARKARNRSRLAELGSSWRRPESRAHRFVRAAACLWRSALSAARCRSRSASSASLCLECSARWWRYSTRLKRYSSRSRRAFSRDRDRVAN